MDMKIKYKRSKMSGKIGTNSTGRESYKNTNMIPGRLCNSYTRSDSRVKYCFIKIDTRHNYNYV